MGADDVIIGREAQYVLWADKFKAFCKNVYVTTDDGSLGEKGFGTVKLQELIDSGDPIDGSYCDRSCTYDESCCWCHKTS